MRFETENWPYVPAKWQEKVAGRRSVRVVVIHTAECPRTAKAAEGVANYFKNVDRKASAHITIDSDSIVQSVKDNNVAFAAPGVNRDGVQIELAGYAKQTKSDWLDVYGLKLLDRAADATAQYCLKYDLPIKHLTDEELAAGARGLIGHVQASRVYKRSTHTDPGVNFPWGYFIEQVAAFADKRRRDAKP